MTSSHQGRIFDIEQHKARGSYADSIYCVKFLIIMQPIHKFPDNMSSFVSMAIQGSNLTPESHLTDLLSKVCSLP